MNTERSIKQTSKLYKRFDFFVSFFLLHRLNCKVITPDMKQNTYMKYCMYDIHCQTNLQEYTLHRLDSILLFYSTRKRPPVLTRAIIDFNFGAAPTDSDPCYVTLHVENTGTVSCEW